MADGTLIIPYRVTDADSPASSLRINFLVRDASTQAIVSTFYVTPTALGQWLNASKVLPAGTYTVDGIVTDGTNASSVQKTNPVTVVPGQVVTASWIGGNTTFHIDWSKMWPLANIWKSCRDPRRSPLGSSGTQTWDSNDELVTNTGTVSTAIGVSYPEFPKGTYVVEWDGSGSMTVNGVNVPSTGGTVAIQSGAGPEGSISVDIHGVCTGIRIYKEGHDPLKAHPDFVAKFSQLGVIRFMDLMGTNSSVVDSITALPKPEDSFYTRQSTYTHDGANQARYGDGLPIEVCCMIAKECNAIPWLHSYHLLDDAGITEMARRAKSVMGTLPCIHEFSNECWNDQPDFQQTNWCRQRGIEAGLDPANQYQAGYRYYAKRVIEAGRAWKSAYPNTVNVLAWQKLEAQYKDYWQLNNVLKPQIDSMNGMGDIDAVSISGYHGGQIVSVADWFNNVDAYMADTKSSWQGFKINVADAWGNKKFFVYEGNWSGMGTTDVMRDARFQAKFEQHLQDAFDVGIDLYCVYTIIAKNGSGQGWGILDYQGQATSPGWQAILAKLGLKSFQV